MIRIGERRIDTVLDAAMLDYENLEDFDDVRFEGEWSLFRSFAGKKKRETILPKASSVFANANSPVGGVSADPTVSPSTFLDSKRETGSTNSPFQTPRRQSTQDNRLASTPRSTSIESIASAAMANGAADELGPTKITDILSGVLLILQLYEVNPAITIQAFSQIFFWIACELFNRILTRKKYLCRTKAVQIRMNITVLEDWVRTNGLPAKTATKHLEPVTQLLKWLQCLSQIREFDTLIGTIQSMKAINPLQMRRAVRDYRFEVNEGRMTEECAQYLAQLQKDWERRRVTSMTNDAAAWKDSDAPESGEGTMEDSTPIDSLFDGTTALVDFIPRSAPECLGELIDSRYMLPFLLPSDNTYLVATPPADAAFQHIFLQSPFLVDRFQSAPLSRSSTLSARPMGWALPRPNQLRELPQDFFVWLKDRKTELRHGRDSARPVKTLLPALDPPLGPSQKVILPARPIAGKIAGLPSVTEDEGTSLANSTPRAMNGTGLPSSGLGLETSP